MNRQAIRAKLVQRVQVGSQLRVYTMAPTQGEAWPFSFLPGQFMQIDATKGEDRTARRAFSIASAQDSTATMEFVLKYVPDGACSGLLEHADEGFEVDLYGPFGRFVLQNTTTPKVFLAAGTGIAPILSMVRTLSDAIPAALVYGVKKHEDRVAANELEDWAEGDGHTYLPFVSQESAQQEHEREGRVTEVIAELQAQHPSAEWYVCGPPEMVKDAKTQLQEELGVEYVFVEAY